MANMLCRTKGDALPKGKPRVYVTCHAADFEKYFDKICTDLFKTHDCAVYYTQDMNAPIPEQDLATDLGSHNLVVVPVTFRLLTEPNRAMERDIPYAMSSHIPVLPLMMEPGLDEIYSREDKFGALQYLNPFSTDASEVAYEKKLKKYLDSVLIGDEMAQRIRAAFDAYIFLSYRKKDRRYANTLMEMIHRNPRYRDIAIWYDEFLNPGENFSENIRKILSDSKLFTLLVTPNLLEEPGGNPNFVMGVEYPAAKASGIGILPVQMQQTEETALKEKFQDLPNCIDPSDEAAFWDRLLIALEKVAVNTNDEEPEHNFLIGLAYLEGIDVEVNRRQGLELITAAAEAELPEAMEKLYTMYENGQGVPFDLREACKWAERLAAFYEKEHGEDDPRTMLVLGDVANISANIGEFRRAAQLWENVVAWAAKEFGYKDPNVVEMTANLPPAYRNIGDYTRANILAKWAYKIAGVYFEKTDASFLQAQQNLVVSYCDLGQYQKAIELQEDACRRIRDIYGWECAETIAAQMGLASLYARIGDFQKACEIGEAAMKIAGDIWQEDSLERLYLKNEMSVIYVNLGDIAKAQAINQEVLTLSQKTYGKMHPLALYAMNNLAQIHIKNDDLQQAFPFIKKSYQGMCSIYGDTHPRTTTMEYNLADIYDKLGQYDKAKEHLTSVYNLRCKLLGEQHPETLAALRYLAVCYDRLLDHKKAIELGEEAYTLAVKVLGEDHPDTLAILHDLARYYRIFGNNKKSFAYFEKAYRKRREVLGKEHPDTVSSWTSMQKVRKALQGLPAERQQELMRQSRELFRQWESSKQQGDIRKILAANRALYACYSELLGEGHHRVIKLMTEQIQMYEDLGLYLEAINVGIPAVENFIDIWGGTHPDVKEILDKLLSISEKLESS